MILENCLFQENKALEDGGGIYFVASDRNMMLILQNTIV